LVLRAGLDPDAAAYIAALTGDGVTVSAAQRTAIDTFYRTGKDEGWYSSLKRLYLPIWAAAAPNARCMVSGTSGTFAGGVTHAAGYVQGNGSTGYFDFGVSPTTAGITVSQGMLAALVKSADTSSGTFDTIIGATGLASAGQVEILEISANYPQGAVGRDGTTIPIASGSTMTPVSGIFVVNRRSGPSLKLHQRKASGVVRSAEVLTQATEITTQNMFAMAQNRNGSSFGHSDCQVGAYAMGLGYASDALVDQFTAALKTLWETCTGLTLP